MQSPISPITVLLQPTLHKGGGQDVELNVCQIKNTFAAALNSTLKKEKKKRKNTGKERESGEESGEPDQTS